MKNNSNLRNWHFYSFLSLLFLFAFSTNISAQKESSFSFGVKGGLASGTFSTQNKANIGSPQMGYQAGAVANYIIKLKRDSIKSFGFGVSIEFLYSNTGVSNIDPEYFYALENDASTTPIINTSIISNQLSIPILISYVFTEVAEGISPKIYFGGDYSFNLKTNSLNTYKTTFKANTIYNNEYASMGNRIATSDYGIILGTGVTIGNGKLLYVVDARYRIGLSNINETTSSYVYSNLTRDMFSLMAGVIYKL